MASQPISLRSRRSTSAAGARAQPGQPAGQPASPSRQRAPCSPTIRKAARPGQPGAVAQARPPVEKPPCRRLMCCTVLAPAWPATTSSTPRLPQPSHRLCQRQTSHGRHAMFENCAASQRLRSCQRAEPETPSTTGYDMAAPSRLNANRKRHSRQRPHPRFRRPLVPLRSGPRAGPFHSQRRDQPVQRRATDEPAADSGAPAQPGPLRWDHLNNLPPSVQRQLDRCLQRALAEEAGQTSS